MKREVQAEIKAGRLWRAKELLRQEIGETGYNKALFEDYANVLVQMKDDVNAGMYYFLSGNRSAEYQEKIGLFLSVRAKKKLGSLTSQFPNSAKFSKKEDFPEPMKTELIQLGLLDSPCGGKPILETAHPESNDSRAWNSWAWKLFVFALVCMMIGLGTIGYWALLLLTALVP